MRFLLYIMLVAGWLIVPQGAQSAGETQSADYAPGCVFAEFYSTDDGRRIIRLPETDQGYRTQAFLEVLASTSADSYTRFVKENFAANQLSDKYINHHIAEVARMSELLADTYVNSLQISANQYRLELSQEASSQLFLVTIDFEPENRHKITSIRAE